MKYNKIKYSESELNEIWRKNLSGWGSKTYYATIFPLICKYLIENNCSGSLLYIGCSNGNKSFIFDYIGFNVTGIDANPEGISRAKIDFPKIDFQCCELETTLPFEDNSFDVIFTCSVFQYFEHEMIMNDCKRVLKKGGSLIMIENLKNNPITRTSRVFLKPNKNNSYSFPRNQFYIEGDC